MNERTRRECQSKLHAGGGAINNKITNNNERNVFICGPGMM